ncbi:MAG: hypothetical protein ACTSQQ_13430 [Candidatus Helarchaeota archaeon]
MWVGSSENLHDMFICFVPAIDETDGSLIYVAEPHINNNSVGKLIVVMPFEFSIILDGEREYKREVSKVVKLTFWDLLETFESLKNISNFIIFHKRELDEIGKQLEAYSNRFWGATANHILDSIFLSRRIYNWMEKQKEPITDEKIYEECLKFHKRNGIVEINENDEIQKFFFDRAVLMRKKEYERKKRIRTTITGVTEFLEQEAYRKAKQLWDKFKNEGKIIYYPPGEYPIL